jgi:predicted nucleic acid-binding protein
MDVKMSNLNLEALAADTAQRLHSVWDALGVASAERDEFLTKLSQDVAAIYQNRVDAQHAKRSAIETEIMQLESLIDSLQSAMEVTSPLVRGPSRHEQTAEASAEAAAYTRDAERCYCILQPNCEGMALFQHRNTLEARRSALQQVRVRISSSPA